METGPDSKAGGRLVVPAISDFTEEVPDVALSGIHVDPKVPRRREAKKVEFELPRKAGCQLPTQSGVQAVQSLAKERKLNLPVDVECF